MKTAWEMVKCLSRPLFCRMVCKLYLLNAYLLAPTVSYFESYVASKITACRRSGQESTSWVGYT